MSQAQCVGKNCARTMSVVKEVALGNPPKLFGWDGQPAVVPSGQRVRLVRLVAHVCGPPGGRRLLLRQVCCHARLQGGGGRPLFGVAFSYFLRIGNGCLSGRGCRASAKEEGRWDGAELIILHAVISLVERMGGVLIRARTTCLWQPSIAQW